jgi:hypothetical protein
MGWPWGPSPKKQKSCDLNGNNMFYYFQMKTVNTLQYSGTVLKVIIIKIPYLQKDLANPAKSNRMESTVE